MDATRRQAQLGIQTIHLMGIVPVPGTPLRGKFVIPAARRADRPLTTEDVCRGVIVVSTLPNIHKHACLSQIVDLEERGRALCEPLRIVHVSADHESHWQEVDQFHPNIQATGYSLCSADPASREAFVTAFGVGVEGHYRIAHGLFILREGVFLKSEVPTDQMRSVEVTQFLRDAARCLMTAERSAIGRHS